MKAKLLFIISVLSNCTLFAGEQSTVNTCVSKPEKSYGGICIDNEESPGSPHCSDFIVKFAHNKCETVVGSPNCQPWSCEDGISHYACGYKDPAVINWNVGKITLCWIEAGGGAASCAACASGVILACIGCVGTFTGLGLSCRGCNLVEGCDRVSEDRTFTPGFCLCKAGCPDPPHPKPTPSPAP